MKNRYEISVAGLQEPRLSGLTAMRSPTSDDADDLAHLLLKAYRGTIDYEGEGHEEALEFANDFLASSTMLDQSRLGFIGDELVTASLIQRHEGVPLVAVIMTDQEHSRTGYATAALSTSLAAIAEAGEKTAIAWITDGNHASERLFASLGAVETA